MIIEGIAVCQFDISVIMVGYNERIPLEKSIPIIDEQCKEFNVELIYIDSSSTDNSAEFISSFNPLNLKSIQVFKIPKKKFHHSKTRNFGFSKSSGGIIVFLGADAIPFNANWLNSLIKPLSKNIVASFSRQIAPKNLNVFNQMRMMHNYPQVSNDNRGRMRRNYFSSVSCAINRNVFNKYSFNELVPVNEDSIFASSVLSDGMKIIYVPESKVIHGHNYNLFEILHRYVDGSRTQKFFAGQSIENSDLNNELKQFFKVISSQRKKIRFPEIILIISYLCFGFIGTKIGSYTNHLPNKINKIFGTHTKTFRLN